MKTQRPFVQPLFERQDDARIEEKKRRLAVDPTHTNGLVAWNGAKRGLSGPNAEKKRSLGCYLVLAIRVLALLGLWRYGLIEQWLKLL